jgi:hypothetical protein
MKNPESAYSNAGLRILSQKRSQLVVVFLFILVNSQSQEFRMAGVRYSYFPESVPVNSFTHEPRFTLHEFQVFLNIPKMLKNKKTVIV